MGERVLYDHKDRTHLGSTKDTPTQTIPRRRGRLRHRFTGYSALSIRDSGPPEPPKEAAARNRCVGQLCRIVPGVFNPVLAKHTNNFNLDVAD